jgi:SpoVK/Ycf46/Vps4 family AAA+-type ATPase
MQTLAANDEPLPKGIHAIHHLPNAKLGAAWDSIVLKDTLKTRLLSQAVLNFTLRGKIQRTVLPLHGVILLVGPPGTGKTTLARGLANRVAKSFSGQKLRLFEVDPHSLTSAAMGKTQRAVSELFSQTLSEAALSGPTIVLLDEVETLAVDRSKLSMDANPVDVHRATDAVLVQLDALAERHPNLLFIATSNFPQAIDQAFTSRCDLVLEIPLPDRDACHQILEECLTGLGAIFPEIAKLTENPAFPECAEAFVGLDGRAIRKVVVNALAATPEVALSPGLVKLEHLASAAVEAKKMRLEVSR